MALIFSVPTVLNGGRIRASCPIWPPEDETYRDFPKVIGGCISPHFINWNYKIMSDLVCKGGVFVCCFLVSINTSIDDTVTLLSPNSAFDLIVPFNNLKHYKYDTKESKTGIN